MPLLGPPNVEKLKAKGDVKGLIKALGYKKDEAMRQQAVEALVEIGAPAVEPLTGALQDSNLLIRSGAVHALGQIGDARAIDALVDVLNDREETRSGILTAALRIRLSAAEALGRIGDARAVPPLTAALEDLDVRVAAMEALAQLDYELAVERFLADLSYYSESFYTDFYAGSEDSDKDNYIHLTAARQLGQLGDTRAVEPLIEMLDSFERPTAAEALGRIGDKRAVKPLAALLDDKDWKVVKAAAEALGQIGDKRAVKPLIAALKDERNNVRRDAARALGQIGDKRAAKPLRALLQDGGLGVSEAASEALDQLERPGPDQLAADLEDKNQGVRERAIEALCKMEGRAVPVLISALMDRRARLDTVVDAITRIGRTPTFGPLFASLKSEKEATRQAVIQVADKLNWRPEDGEALAWYWITKRRWERCSKIGSPAVGPLVTALNDEDQGFMAAWALGEVGDAGAVGPLVTALQDENQSMRQNAVEALGKIRDEGAIAPLSDTLQDEAEGVRHAAVEALGRIGDRRAVEPLAAALEDASGWVREAAARALRIGNARAVHPLISALDDAEERVRRAAIWALGWIGDTRAVEPLIAILDDAVAKREAAQALDRLNWQPQADETGARYWVAKSEFEKCVAIGAPAVPVLIAALKEGDRHVRDGASGALAQIGTPAVGPLLVAIQDEHWQVRRDAVKVLGQIGDARATESLITALADKTPDVSKAAINALGQIGDVAAVELLNPARTLHSAVAALKGHSRSVRQTAAKVLIELYTSGRVPPKQKQLVLDQKAKIKERHTDRSDHTDYGKDCAPFDSHTDTRKHTDRGIGMDFPL